MINPQKYFIVLCLIAVVACQPRPQFPLYFEARGLGICTGSGTFSCPPQQSANVTFDFHQWMEFDEASGYLMREREDDLLQPGPVIYGRSYLEFNYSTEINNFHLFMLYDNSTALECFPMQVKATPINRNYLQNATFVGQTIIPTTGEKCYEYLNYFSSTQGDVDWTTYVSIDGTDSIIGVKSFAQKFEEYYSWTQGYDQPFDEEIFVYPACN